MKERKYFGVWKKRKIIFIVWVSVWLYYFHFLAFYYFLSTTSRFVLCNSVVFSTCFSILLLIIQCLCFYIKWFILNYKVVTSSLCKWVVSYHYKCNTNSHKQSQKFSSIISFLQNSRKVSIFDEITNTIPQFVFHQFCKLIKFTKHTKKYFICYFILRKQSDTF